MPMPPSQDELLPLTPNQTRAVEHIGGPSMRRRGLIVAVVLAVLMASSCAGAQAAQLVSVGRSTVMRPLPGGFLGLSFEFRGLEEYLGSDPSALDPVFLQLIRNLAPDQHPVVRIGGDSTDWTWWPVPHMRSPGGVHYGLSSGWAQVARSLAQSLGARLILGVNFEADSRRLAAREANMMVKGIGAQSIEALELGNEPELYGTFAWFRTPDGQAVTGRPPSYSVTDYLADYAHIASALPGVPLAGPAGGSPSFLADLGAYLVGEPRVRLVTIHAYPLQHCAPTQIPTISELLNPATVSSLAAQVGASVAVAHRHGRSLRVDEMNAVTCGGYGPVTKSFGAALWALEQLFVLDRAGVDGVNVHTVPNITQHLITVSEGHGRWTAAVLPEYYGLLAFAEAAPAGSRLLPVSGSVPSDVQIYATTLHGQVRVTIINTAHRPRSFDLRIAGVTRDVAQLMLTAGSLAAQSGVSLGGQSIEPATGALGGVSRAGVLRPAGRSYRVRVPAGSAMLLMPR
jgi:hypothetical protein